MAASSDDTAGGSGKAGLAVPLIIMTVLAAGAGLACGMFLLGANAKSTTAAKEAPSKEKSKAEKGSPKHKKSAKKENRKGKSAEEHGNGDDDEKKSNVAATLRAIDLPPVLASIGDAKKAWVRMELKALSADKPSKDEAVLMLKISQDILAYVRTLKVRDIQSASGFYLLRSNLEEIARIRSNGTVTGIAIQGFVVE